MGAGLGSNLIIIFCFSFVAYFVQRLFSRGVSRFGYDGKSDFVN